MAAPRHPTLRDGETVLRPAAPSAAAGGMEDAGSACRAEDTRGTENVSDAGSAGSAGCAGGDEGWDRDPDRRTVTFVVEQRDEVAGTVALCRVGDGRAELSWAVGAGHRRRGVATRAVALLVRHAFDELGLARVEAYVAPGDTASLRVAARTGLRREGLLRGRRSVGAGGGDLVLLARLAGDPDPFGGDGFRAVLNAGLPTKRVIAQGLIRNEDGDHLLCELVYKRYWDLPGGVVDPGESPAVAVIREIREELGIDVAVRGLAAVNWLPPWRGWDDACLLVFDLGVHPAGITEQMTLEAREIRSVHWCSVRDIEERAADYTARFMRRLAGRAAGAAYLEDGRDPT